MDIEEITIRLEGAYMYSKEDMNRLIQHHLPLVILTPLFQEHTEHHYITRLWVMNVDLGSVVPSKREQLMKMYKKIIKLLLK